MLNNEAFRRIRYALELDDATTVKIFADGLYTCDEEAVKKFSRKDSDETRVIFPDKEFAHFLNGLIVHRRGGKPAEVAPNEAINNNKTIKKLRIAMEMYEDEMLVVFDYGDIRLSRHKLSALFRTEGHKHFRECNDHTLRQFLKGLAIYCDRQRQSQSS
ncbi:DUF1456 family protein [Leucothrix arctica]|uniref:DUF1456 domain-containing protein n=1 Tax=Leucothrix arctica TaxID=1481894 RepID=A0A317CPQ6_9GAMM|nr:DUF1456 family protein [Leucothrix arctica]PWQ98360.1 DUF1456 domain-containing protein [Leucothrix arctica]